MGVNKYDRVCQKERLENIANLFQKKDYEVVKRLGKYDVTWNRDKNIFSVIKGLHYPSEIIEFLAEFNMQCKVRKEQGYYCKEDCENILNRHPILRMSQSNDEIIFLEKRGRN